MDDGIKEKVEKRMKEGWIKTWMMIEVMAISPEAAKSALEGHVEKMKNEEGTLLYKKQYGEVKKVEKPLPNVAEGYSYVVEFEYLVSDYDRLMTIVMNYGPSSVEILEPSEIRMTLDQAQGALNSVSAMMHKFASQAGGVIISS
ncbi:MAG: hypothetical protein GXO64_04850 [Candidatus Micrarchaeota archaeon]|nr:hypothetical protein [Candidatus Micrarchaeota archaeon]